VAKTMRENATPTFFISRAAARAMLAGRARAIGAAGNNEGERRTPHIGIAPISANPGNPHGGGRIVLVAPPPAARRVDARRLRRQQGRDDLLRESMAVELAPHGHHRELGRSRWSIPRVRRAFADGGRARIASGIPVGRIAVRMIIRVSDRLFVL